MLHTHETFYFQRDDAAARPESALPPYVAGQISLRPPPPPALPDESWANGIAQAAERIAGLAQARSASEPSRRASAENNLFDFAAVLELLRQERFDVAMDRLSRLPAESEDNPDVQLFRAVVLVNRGQMHAAEQTCRTLLALDEFNAGAHYLLGLCREQLGEHASARDHYRTALYFEPTFAMPHLRIGLLARAGGERSEAQRELGLALALLAEEDGTRVVLFGGGFSRELLEQLCRSELRACGGVA
jgi:chemotaxis protein methyltransferase CheR